VLLVEVSVWKTAPVDGIHDRALVESLMEELHRWCFGEQGKKAAQRVISKSRAPITVDDLLDETQEKVLAAIRKDPGRFEPFEPARYCTGTMKNIVATLWSRGHAGVEVLVGDPYQLAEAPTDHSAHWRVDDGDVDRFRTTVEAIGTDPVHVSGALTMTYLMAQPDLAPHDVPWPKAGVKGDRQTAWPALWYATRSVALFPGDGRTRRDGQARQRQRHLDKIDGLRLRAISALTLADRV
jgi:hypothetical protein